MEAGHVYLAGALISSSYNEIQRQGFDFPYSQSMTCGGGDVSVISKQSIALGETMNLNSPSSSLSNVEDVSGSKKGYT